MSNWIDIKKELPLIGEEVLLRINFKKKIVVNENKRWPSKHIQNIKKVIFMGGRREAERFFLDLESELGIFSYTVTHWIKLPEELLEEKIKEDNK